MHSIAPAAAISAVRLIVKKSDIRITIMPASAVRLFGKNLRKTGRVETIKAAVIAGWSVTPAVA